MSYGPDPWRQAHWDWRAAANFAGGGAGAGAVAMAALLPGEAGSALRLAGLALVALGLGCVWLEIGRPWRALNVFRHPQRSWMSREAYAALVLFGAGAASLLRPGGAAPIVAALAALAFAYCQARMLRAARGIPAWREPLGLPLLLASALAEGGGLLALLAGAALLPPPGSPALQAPLASAALATWPTLVPVLLWALALAARLALWLAWRRRLAASAAPRALAAVDRAGRLFKPASALPLALLLGVLVSPLPPAAAQALLAAAGVLALAGGAAFKFALVTRASFNQGFALAHLPVRGARR